MGTDTRYKVTLFSDNFPEFVVIDGLTHEDAVQIGTDYCRGVHGYETRYANVQHSTSAHPCIYIMNFGDGNNTHPHHEARGLYMGGR